MYLFAFRLSIRGVGILCELEDIRRHSVSQVCVSTLDALASMRRYSVNDELITRLLHGVRLCL